MSIYVTLKQHKSGSAVSTVSYSSAEFTESMNKLFRVRDGEVLTSVVFHRDRMEGRIYTAGLQMNPETRKVVVRSANGEIVGEQG